MKKKFLLGISIVFGLVFINAGLNKLFNYIPMPDDIPEIMLKINAAFMEIGFIMPLIAIAEIVGGVLFMTNRFRALGAIIIFPILIGIFLTHLLYAPSGLIMAIVLWIIEIWVLIENRQKILPLIK